MVRNKQGKAPSKRISDELYSTPIVAKKQNNVTKKKREVSRVLCKKNDKNIFL